MNFTSSKAYIIGIDKYKNLSPLQTAVNDARKLEEILKFEHKFSNTILLSNSNKQEIENLIEKTMPDEINENDRVVFYFAGHGIAQDNDKEPQGYIAPADAQANNSGSLISMQYLNKQFSNLKCRHFLLILDSCFAGSFRWSSGFRDFTMLPKRIYKERYDRYIKDPAWQVITSAAYDQKALDIIAEQSTGKRNAKNEKHSPFALALFDALKGAADIVPANKPDGIITATELYLYLRDRIERQTIRISENYRQTPLIFPLQNHDKGEFIFLNPKHHLNIYEKPKRNPYKGLFSYETKDADLFYGREKVIENLFEKVIENSLIIVTGASGTGKSSLVKAGLLPKFQNENYSIEIMRPGKTPLKTVSDTLQNTNSNKLLLVIDQFEELITQCSDKNEREQFIKKIEHFISQNEDTKIIITVRSDFEPQFEKTSIFKNNTNFRFLIPPLTQEELREIIVKPAIQEVLWFEPEKLVDKIINDVIQAPGALPLLSFTLWQLYEESYKNGRELKQETYQNLGGVIGALRKKADEIYNNFDEQHQNTMRKIMLRMVSQEGGKLAGRRINPKELIYSDEKENKRVETVINALRNARLIVTGKDNDNEKYIEPAHDALIKAWGTLWEWIKAFGEENINLQRKLNDVVNYYYYSKINLSNNEADIITEQSLLWHNDPRLETLKLVINSKNNWLNRKEIEFINESLKRREEIIQKLKDERDDAVRQRDSANALYLTSTAREQAKIDSTKAIRLAELALKIYPTRKSTINIHRTLTDVFYDTSRFYHEKIQHSDEVVSAQFSPDGNKIITASLDNSAKICYIETGRIVLLNGHTSILTSAQFSPSGKKVVTASNDFTAKLWDVATGKLIATLRHNGNVQIAQFSPDEKRIITGSNDKTAKIWDTTSGSILLSLTGHTGNVDIASFSPNGKKIITNSKNTAKIWCANSGKEIVSLNGHKDSVISAEFSSDGNRIITTSEDKTAKIWDANKGVLIFSLNHTDIVIAGQFSPCGTKVITASWDKSAKIWNMATGKLMFTLKGHTHYVSSAKYSPDGKIIVTASWDKTIKIWNAITGKEEDTFYGHEDSIKSVNFSLDSKRIISASKDYTAKIWNIKRANMTTLFTEHSWSAQFSPNGKKIVTYYKDIKIWNSITGELLNSISGNFIYIYSLQFSPDGKKIITTSGDKSATIWDFASGKIITSLMHEDQINSAYFSPNGKNIVTASYRTAEIWDVKTGQILISLKWHSDKVFSAQFSPDSKKIITASKDNTAKIWDSTSGEEIISLEHGRWTWVNTAKFSPDGSKIATFSGDKTIKIWDTMTGQLLNTLKQRSKINSVNFSPDSKKIITASDDSTAKIWDITSAIEITSLMHNDWVKSARFSTDGKKIVTVSGDNVIKIWLTPEGIEQILKTLPIYKLQYKDFQYLGIDFLIIKYEDDIKNYLTYLAEDFWELNLSNLQLNYLPKEITKFNNLQELNLTNNNLIKLPVEIIQLTKLKTLTLIQNNFSDPEKQKVESWFEGTECEIIW